MEIIYLWTENYHARMKSGGISKTNCTVSLPLRSILKLMSSLWCTRRCTQVSLGVGYELAYAEAHDKEVHIFYRPAKTQLSAMLTGNEYFHIHKYVTEEEVLNKVRELWG